MPAISYETSELLLKIAFLIGAITDLLAIFPMLSKRVGSYIFGSKSINKDVGYNYAMGLGASLMAGWTALLFWGSIMPMQRRDLLIITVAPVILGIMISTIKAAKNKYLSKCRIIPLIIHLSLVSIYYIFAYISSMQFGN